MNLFRSVAFLTIAASIAMAQTVPDLAPAATYNVPGGAYWAAAGDFNGDGRIDLAAPDSSIQGFWVSLGAPDGLYSSPVPRGYGVIVQAMSSADFNNDGRADLLLSTSAGVRVLLGQTDGAFTSAGSLALPVTATYAASADFNRDGRLDVVAAGTGGFAVALGVGNGTFQNGSLYAQASAGSYVMTADFNNDGNMDFVGSTPTSGYTYLGNGAGGFGVPVSTMIIPYGAVTARFNSDAFPDIAMMTVQPRQDGSNHAISISLGLGDGRFQGYSNYVTGVPMYGLATGDYNLDGRTDIATWISSTQKLRVFANDGTGVVTGDLLAANTNTHPAGIPISVDIDGNGSSDIVHGWGTGFAVYRSTHGNPPLLAQVRLNPSTVIGGSASSTATVLLGGAAPSGGANVTLAIGDTSLASLPGGNSVTIPAGANSATFLINSAPVAVASSTTISATWNGVTQAATLNVVSSYSLSGLSVNPASQYGIFAVPATITLDRPADNAAVVSIVSANPALASVPASVQVPAGATSVSFNVTLSPVSVSIPVNITASMGGVSRSAIVTILPAADSVAITRAIYTAKTAELKLDATSSNASATITVYNPNTGALIGSLQSDGRGRYKGTVFAPASMTTVRIKSSLGGTAIAAVQPKV